jgi:SWI/SNF-related matrix-associated actin-dependent regulator 1 of chromatin subfamily A
LLPFQAEGAAWLISRLVANQGAILCDDPGLGKTIQALIALVVSRSLPAIVVCPTSVKHSWLEEVKHLTMRLRIVPVEHRLGEIEPAHVVVLSYSVLRQREHQLMTIGARSIVFDEGHLLKEPVPSTGHRAAVGTRLAHLIGRPVILTGTPVVNRPKELWRLLHIVDKVRWPWMTDFFQRYCTAPHRGELDSGEVIVTKHSTVKRIKELQVVSEPYILRRRRQEVLRSMLLPKKHLRLLIEMEPVDRQSYEEAERDVVSWLRRVVNDERAQNAAKGQAIVKINMLRRIAAVGKLRKAVVQYLQRWLTIRKEPLVIFAHHRIVLAGVIQICRSLGSRVSLIKGGMSSEQRAVEIDRFQRGGSNVFVGPIKAAGLGINLYRARHMLCLERLWSPSLMEQMESRCHRMGQKQKVEITYMDAKDTVDEHIADVLRIKQRVISRLIDDEKVDDKELTTQTIDEVIKRMLSPGSYKQDKVA